MRDKILLLFVVVILGCKPSIKRPEVPVKDTIPERINLVYDQRVQGKIFTEYFMIIEVDSHLIMTVDDGGLIHLPSCPCFKNTKIEKIR